WLTRSVRGGLPRRCASTSLAGPGREDRLRLVPFSENTAGRAVPILRICWHFLLKAARFARGKSQTHTFLDFGVTIASWGMATPKAPECGALHRLRQVRCQRRRDSAVHSTAFRQRKRKRPWLSRASNGVVRD